VKIEVFVKMRVFRESCMASAKIVKAEDFAGLAKAILKAIPGSKNAGTSCSNNKSRTKDFGARILIKGEFKPDFLGL